MQRATLIAVLLNCILIASLDQQLDYKYNQNLKERQKILNRPNFHRVPQFPQPHQRSVSRSDEKIITSQLHKTPLSPPARIRFVRATDNELSAAVEHMQRIARLATGISVQMGLIDGKISSDELISELLRLGQVTPSQIVSMDGSKINFAMTALKDLPNKLTADASTTRAEEKLNAMGEVRRMVEGLDVLKWEQKDDFVAEMTALEQNGLNLATVKAVHDTVDSWNAKLKDIKNLVFDAKDSGALARVSTYVQDLKKSSTQLLALLNELVINQKKTYQKIENATDALTSVIKFVDVVRKISSNDVIMRLRATDIKDFKAYTNNLRTLSNASNAVADVLPSLQHVKALTQTSKASTKPSLAFSGFKEGFEDIRTIFVDFTDSWMQKVVETIKMTRSLEPLKNILPMFDVVQNALGSPGDEQRMEIEKFSKIVDSIHSISLDPLTMDSVMNSYVSCSRTFAPDADPEVDAPKPLFQLATDLDNTLSEVDKKVESFIQILNTDNIKKLLAKTQDLAVVSNDPAQLAKTLNALKTAKEVKELSEELQKAENMQIFTIENQIPMLKKSAGEILKKINSVDVFQKSLSSYPVFFQCLQGIDEQKTSATSDTVTMVKQFRAIDPKIITDGESIVNKVKKAGNDMKALQQAVRAMKGHSSAESDALRVLPDPQDLSRTIGAATRGIVAMKALLDSRASVDVVIEGSTLVESQLKTVKMNQQDAENLLALAKINTTLTALLVKLDGWKSQKIDDQSSLLQSYSNLFKTAKDIPGTTANLHKMIESLDQLIHRVNDPPTKTNLQEIQKSLTILDSIGLDFAFFSSAFVSSKQSLDALDVFFASYRTTTMAPTVRPPISTRPSISSVRQYPTSLAASTESSTSTTSASVIGDIIYWFIVVIIVLAICFVLVVGSWRAYRYFVSLYRRCKEKTKVKASGNDLDKDKKDHGKDDLTKDDLTAPSDSNTTLPKTPPKDNQSNSKEDPKEMRDDKTQKNTSKEADLTASSTISTEKQQTSHGTSAESVPGSRANSRCSSESHSVNPLPIKSVSRDSLIVDITQESEREMDADEYARLLCEMFIRKVADSSAELVNDTNEPEKMRRLCENLVYGTPNQNFLTQMEVVNVNSEILWRVLPMESRNTFVIKNHHNGKLGGHFLHANTVDFHSGLQMVLMQGPNKTKRAVERLFWALKEEKARYMVQLCSFAELDCEVVPLFKGGEISHGRFKVKCLEAKVQWRNSVIERWCSVEFEDKPSFTFIHFQHVLWDPEWIPSSPVGVVKILRTIRTSPTPVFVLCTDGVKRSGTFAFIEYYIQLLSKMKIEHFELGLQQAIIELRKFRAGVMWRWYDMLFAIRALIEYFYPGENLDEKTQSVLDACIIAATGRAVKDSDIPDKITAEAILSNDHINYQKKLDAQKRKRTEEGKDPKKETVSLLPSPPKDWHPWPCVPPKTRTSEILNPEDIPSNHGNNDVSKDGRDEALKVAEPTKDLKVTETSKKKKTSTSSGAVDKPSVRRSKKETSKDGSKKTPLFKPKMDKPDKNNKNDPKQNV